MNKWEDTGLGYYDQNKVKQTPLEMVREFATVMNHPLDGNMIAADAFYEKWGKMMCDLVELDDGGFYCEECAEYVDEPCEEIQDED